MTVIAWDGRSLAADKMTDFGGLHATTTKIFVLPDGSLVGTTGLAAMGKEMVQWLASGAKPESFPAGDQRNPEKCCAAVVVTRGGKLLQYEHTPYPLHIENRYWAVGSGRDFAMAAMHMGANAMTAVEVANSLCNSCGNGVDVLELTCTE